MAGNPECDRETGDDRTDDLGHPQGHGITVKAAANGQPVAAHTYPNGARVYVVESSLGDDSGGSDYNLGDNGLVVADATGRVVQ